MLQRPGDGDMEFCTQSTVLSRLHLYSYWIITGQMCQILTPLVFLFPWKFPCCIWFRTLSGWNTSKKISLTLTEMHKGKIPLVKTYNLMKKPIIYNYPHKLIFACLLIPEVRGGSSFWHLCEVNFPLIPFFFFTFHPPVHSWHSPRLLHKAQALCVQQPLSSLGEVFPSPHTSQWMH